MTRPTLALQTRVGLVFAAVIVPLLLVIATTVGCYLTARADDARVARDNAPVVRASYQMLLAVGGIQDDGFIALKEPGLRGRSRGMLESHLAGFEGSLAVAERLAKGADQRRLLVDLRTHFNAVAAGSRLVMQRLEADDLAGASVLHRDEVGPHVRALHDEAERLYAAQTGEMERQRDVTDRRDLTGIIASLAIALAGAVVATLLWRQAVRLMVAPLAALRDGAAELADGSFPRVEHPAAERTVELAALQRDFNRMSRRLAEATHHLQEANAGLEDQVAERTRSLGEANQELGRLVAQLETLDGLKSDFMAVVSHELLTPINFIIGLGSSLEDGLMGDLNPRQQDALEKMLGGADRLTRMVRNTLEYTQLEAGNLAVHPEPVDLAGVLGRLDRGAIAQRQQQLVSNLPLELPLVWADPDRLGQVLAELVDNASKFSPEGSMLAIGASATADEVTVSVSDSGSGIPEEALQHLFTPFYQVNFTRTRVHGGLGLGLPVAYHLVLKMGGTMIVDSRPGEGTTVRVTLPTRASKVAALPHARHNPAAG